MNEKLKPIDMLIEDVYVIQKFGEKHDTVRIRLAGYDKNKRPILEIFTTKPKEAEKIADAIFQKDIEIKTKSLKIPSFDEIDKKFSNKLDELEGLLELGWTYFTSKIDKRFGFGDDSDEF